jgi:hypothetical protein
MKTKFLIHLKQVVCEYIKSHWLKSVKISLKILIEERLSFLCTLCKILSSVVLWVGCQPANII